MNNNSVNIARRALRVQGTDFTFKRQPKTKYGELDFSAELEEVATIRCIYFVSKFSFLYIGADVAIQGKTAQEPKPMLICEWKDAEPLKMDDIVKVENTLYYITKVADVDNKSQIAMISINEVQQR